MWLNISISKPSLEMAFKLTNLYSLFQIPFKKWSLCFIWKHNGVRNGMNYKDFRDGGLLISFNPKMTNHSIPKISHIIKKDKREFSGPFWIWLQKIIVSLSLSLYSFFQNMHNVTDTRNNTTKKSVSVLIST